MSFRSEDGTGGGARERNKEEGERESKLVVQLVSFSTTLDLADLLCKGIVYDSCWLVSSHIKHLHHSFFGVLYNPNPIYSPLPPTSLYMSAKTFPLKIQPPLPVSISPSHHHTYDRQAEQVRALRQIPLLNSTCPPSPPRPRNSFSNFSTPILCL